MVRFFCPAVMIGMNDYPNCPGLYSAIFFIYMQCHISKELGIEKRNIFLYALGVLYTLCSAIIAFDVAEQVTVSKFGSIITAFLFTLLSGQIQLALPLVPERRLYIVSTAIIGLCDFISQAVLVCINLYPF